MKTINQIAQAIHKTESETGYASDVDYIKRQLLNVKSALLNGRYYTGVESVSSSGMSRVIKIRYIKNNKLCGVDSFIYSLACCDKDQRISGCGMDMLFAAQYNLFRELCPRFKYQDRMKRYNSL
jgi:hypothetical protein